MQKVFNPSADDLHFQYDSAEYVVKAGEEATFVDYVAKHAAKRLADRSIMTNNPEEHRVLMGAYLENSEPEVIAQRLGIDLAKIRKEAMTKEKEKARVFNLEAQVLEQNKKINALIEKIENRDEPSAPKISPNVAKKVEEENKEEEKEAETPEGEGGGKLATPEEIAKEEEADELEEEKEEEGVQSYEDMAWNDLQKLATEKGVYKVGMKKDDVIKELNK